MTHAEVEQELDTIDEARVRPHLVRLARDIPITQEPTLEDLSAAGVLLQDEEGHKGIMTAEHCIRRIAGRQDRGEWDGNHIVTLTQQLVPRQGGHVVPVRIPLAGAKGYRANDNSETPDIAWIPLHTGDSRMLERHGAAFARPWRKKTPAATLVEESNGSGMIIFTAIHGWLRVHEQATEGGERQAIFSVLEMLEDWKKPVGIQCDGEGWDWSDYVFHDPESPSHRRTSDGIPPGMDVEIDLSTASREGYSGGPIWRFWKIDGDEEWEQALMGIAFYQEDQPDGRRVLRAHREQSIAKLMGMQAPGYYTPE